VTAATGCPIPTSRAVMVTFDLLAMSGR
jgi:hypothetical protein